jgi:glycosyltransferase involved in cell wall biosynthesis
MKIVFFANTDWFIYNFNLKYIKFLKSSGFEIFVLCPKGKYIDEFRKLSLNWIEVPIDRMSLNIFHNLKIIFFLLRIFNNIKPDVVHNLTLKCILLSSFSNLFSNVKLNVNEFTGLGFFYTSKSIVSSFFRVLFNIAFFIFSLKKNYKFIVLNKTDFDYFKNFRFLSKNSLYLIPGSGIDCNLFFPSKNKLNSKFRVLLPSRLLVDKGVMEFFEVAELLKKENLNIEFLLAGSFDSGNPSSIDESTLLDRVNKGYISWLGHVDNMVTLYQSIDLVVLPSYREGLPNCLTEGAACGLPLVSTLVPGCVDVVVDGENGFLVPAKDVCKLADAIRLLYFNPDKCAEFGFNSRLRAEKIFSNQNVFLKKMAVYNLS